MIDGTSPSLLLSRFARNGPVRVARDFEEAGSLFGTVTHASH
jgi:hypothetical protein